MKTSPFFIFLFGSILSVQLASADPFYNQTIHINTVEKDPVLSASIQDLKDYLEKITNKSFMIKQNDNSETGICLLLNNSKRLPDGLEKMLNEGSIESFVIMSNNNKLLLVANHPTGLSRAVYTYLDRLGVRWYFPGSTWEFVPQLNNIVIQEVSYFSPSFSLRNFFGTGGITLTPKVDPSSKVLSEWSDWARRNRMGGEVELAGHYGETFNSNHQNELHKHPEYLALVNGKRSSWRIDVKWCISNPNFRELFIQDRITEAKQKLANERFSNRKITITVDPADGYDDCECDECKRMGSYSERIFYLANEVAKELSRISPRLYANLYGYNTHAHPPSFTLSDHLIVQIVPYAFQSVGTPEQMIEKWKTRGNRLFLYDYYGIPDWNFNLPLDGNQTESLLLRKIAYWKQQGIKGFTLESSYSIGSNGMGLFLAAKLGWNINTNVEREKLLFYKNIFNNHSAAKEYYTRVSERFYGISDVPYLLNVLERAKKTSNKKIRERLLLLQGYMHYVLLYYNWKKASVSDKNKAWKELISYCWQIYFTRLVHTTRISELWVNIFPIDEASSKDWNPYNQNAAGIERTVELSLLRLEELVLSDIAKYQLFEDFPYTTSRKRYDIIRGSNKFSLPEGAMILDFPKTYMRTDKKGEIHFFLRLNESLENVTQSVAVTCLDIGSQSVIQRKDLVINKNWREVVLSMTANKTYEINIINRNQWVRFYAAENQWVAFENIPIYSVLGNLWFFVPTNKKYIYYSNDAADQPSFADSHGKAIVPERMSYGNIYRLKVTSGNTWWVINNSEYKSLQFYGEPDLFFLHRSYAYIGVH
jgi:hypothetical protein